MIGKTTDIPGQTKIGVLPSLVTFSNFFLNTSALLTDPTSSIPKQGRLLSGVLLSG